jgi:uncharacterized membrane-anchored protein YhcB (DUF1043 family)
MSRRMMQYAYGVIGLVVAVVVSVVLLRQSLAISALIATAVFTRLLTRQAQLERRDREIERRRLARRRNDS